MKKRILITGGLGYIGSHTAVALNENGFDIGIIDDCSNAKPQVLDALETITGKKIPFGQVSVSNSMELSNWIQENGPFHGVIHFAAFKSVGESVLLPLKYYQNNVTGLINLLETLQKHEIKNFVFSSSCSVYGNPDSLPVTEDTPFKKAESPYAHTKQIGEQLLNEYAQLAPFKTAILRYFNPIGAHQSALIGEIPLRSPDNLIPVVTQAVAGWRGSLTIHGTDYPTPDGTCVRDYIDVNDLAIAHTRALEKLFSIPADQGAWIYNLGTGKGSSVLEVIQTFEKATGQQVPHQMGPRRPGDVVAIFSDCKKSNQELNWKAEISLADSLLSAWNWQKKLVRNSS